MQILSPIALLSSLLKWQICLKSEEIPSNLSAWKQEGQVQVAAILYSLPMTGGLHMEINSGPLLPREEAMLEPFYAAIKDYAKENGAIELVIKPYDTYRNL